MAGRASSAATRIPRMEPTASTPPGDAPPLKRKSENNAVALTSSVGMLSDATATPSRSSPVRGNESFWVDEAFAPRQVKRASSSDVASINPASRFASVADAQELELARPSKIAVACARVA